MTQPDFAIAVFPFLKTSAPVTLGKFTFRSTSELGGLSEAQAVAVNEITQMLYVQGDLRVKSATYAIIPDLDINPPDSDRLLELGRLRDLVAYLYSAPHEIFADVFLHPEEISLVVFNPAAVDVHLTRPEHHTVTISGSRALEPDSRGQVPGYRGLYNFRDYFWIESGSRLYGPKPHIILNISQDLWGDLGSSGDIWPDCQLLLRLLSRPDNPAALRVYSALRWYNAANEHGLDESRAILNLAVAFETLLKLPEGAKTDRLIDAISLLLGRTERLDEWADQFYHARSRVAHEGRIVDRYFYASGDGKRATQIADVFGSLMLYGRQVFRLCLRTLLVGIDQAQRADLQEKFITKNERYQKICEILRSDARAPSEKLSALNPILLALERYRFVSSVVDSAPLLAAVQLACATVLTCAQELPDDLASAIGACAVGKRGDGDLARLAALEALNENLERLEQTTVTQEMHVVRGLVNLAWMSLFQRYFWLKQEAASAAPDKGQQ